MINLLTVAENVYASLSIMWKGMLAIFIAITIIILVTYLLNMLCVRRENAAQKRAEKLSAAPTENDNNQK